MRKYILILLFFSFMAFDSMAQVDPVLSGMILIYKEKAEKTLKGQEKAMMLQTTGHIWTRDEVKATTDLQQKYNDYLDRFNDIIVYAAQIYGFYHEVGMLTDNFGELTRQLKNSPTNALAVALTPRRNTIYRELIMTSVDICNDVRMLCLSDIKMTEKQRIEIVFGIRPKLKQMNRKLSRLARAIRYTSLSDVWCEIDSRARNPVDKLAIGDAAFRRWRQNGRVKVHRPLNDINRTGYGKTFYIDSIKILDPVVRDSTFIKLK